MLPPFAAFDASVAKARLGLREKVRGACFQFKDSLKLTPFSIIKNILACPDLRQQASEKSLVADMVFEHATA